METPSAPAKPNPGTFGLTLEQAAALERNGYVNSARGDDESKTRAILSWVVCTIGITALAINNNPTWFDNHAIGVIILSGFLAWYPAAFLAVVIGVLFPGQASRQLSPESQYLLAIREYQAALTKAENEQRYQDQMKRLAEMRAKHEYWTSLSGYEFERELAELFRGLGYNATVTPASGDEGVDIDMTRDGKRIVVQCKAHRAPIGPGPVRDLYGTLLHTKADGALLVSLGGFTEGARKFATGKPIHLRGTDYVIALQAEVRV